MLNINTTVINQVWPEQELEEVPACPFCESHKRKVAYANVQDWSFFSSPGKWTYWDCDECASLYLAPRPNSASIGRAYQSYYTHIRHSYGPLYEALKTRLRNECLYALSDLQINPRLHLPKFATPILKLLKNYVHVPFGLTEMASMTPGKLLDVGCGSGNFMTLAQQMGWQALGLEIDEQAYKVAKNKGLDVIHASVEHLNQFKQMFEVIVCSHVLEHINTPVRLLNAAYAALKPDGILFLSLPNAKSWAREYFGSNWRGLEAPRHLAIPSAQILMQILSDLGFEVNSVYLPTTSAVAESLRISRRDSQVTQSDWREAELLVQKNESSDFQTADFIHFICRRTN